MMFIPSTERLKVYLNCRRQLSEVNRCVNAGNIQTFGFSLLLLLTFDL